MQEMLVLPATLPRVTVYVHATNEARRQQIHSPQQQAKLVNNSLQNRGAVTKHQRRNA